MSLSAGFWRMTGGMQESKPSKHGRLTARRAPTQTAVVKTSTHATELLPFAQPRKAVFGAAHQLILLLALVLDSRLVLAQGIVLLTTSNNPTPANFDLFGETVAAMGDDQELIGAGAAAGGAGEVYLFSLNGTLLTTFTNPGTAGNGFGGLGGASGLAALGNDRVLIGAYNSVGGVPLEQVGAAFLFGTNGTLLASFTNPAAAKVQAFGWAVAALGNDRVIISGLANVNNPPPYPGGVYLFTTNGTLLTTFTNPTPAIPGGFGASLAVVAGNRLLIGAPYAGPGAAGVAYLYRTNGALLTTITNPVPADGDNFGQAVAAVGSDRLLISAIDYAATKGNGGSAYLFTTNGTLLTTFTNPTPAAYDYFGWSVAAVGSSRVIIGAYQDGTGALRSGAAYIFSTNGTLMTTMTNPTPAVNDYFGWAVAAMGKDRVLIGGVWDDTGATEAGSAYLFALPYPPLSIARNGFAVSVGWISAEAGLILQQADSPGSSVVWSDTTNSVSINGLTNVVQQTRTTTNRFFRLHRP